MTIFIRLIINKYIFIVKKLSIKGYVKISLEYNSQFCFSSELHP